MSGLIKNIQSNKKKIEYIVLVTVVLYLCAHGYRAVNSMFSGDALLMIYQNDYAWQISLGRYVQPLWIFLRGSISSPWLITLLTMIWLAGAGYLVIDILKINNKLSMFLIAAYLTVNTTLVVANAGFLPWLDFYALALFFAVLAVWFIENFTDKKKWYNLCFGVFAIVLSLGTYQAYVCNTIVLIMILLLMQLITKAPPKDITKKIISYGICLLIAGIIYYAGWKVCQRIFHIWTSDGYNGMANLGDFASSSFMELLILTYKNVWNYFWYPEIFVSLYFRGHSLGIIWSYILRTINIVLLMGCLVGLIYKNKEKKSSVQCSIFQMVIILLFPLGANAVCMIAKGMEHTLMTYAFIFFYIGLIKLLDSVEWEKNKNKILTIFRRVLIIFLFILAWNTMVYSNQVYLKKQMQEEAAEEMMTNVVYDIQHMEGYVAGNTPVALCGNFDASLLVKEAEGLQDLLPYGMGKTSMFYGGPDYALLNYCFGANLNLTRVDSTDERIQQLPLYPEAGAIAYVDGVLVVKISEN